MGQLVWRHLTGKIIMVVQDNTEKNDDKHNDTDNKDNSENKNGTDTENGDIADRLENDSETDEESEESETVDLSRLQELIPSVAAKDNVTHLDIILEAIRYIDSLQDKLADKIERGEIVPLQVTAKRKRGEE